MTVKELRNSKEYKFHHTGSKRGYVSRKCEGIVEEYKGRFGEGFIILTPRFDSSSLVNVEYYIRVV